MGLILSFPDSIKFIFPPYLGKAQFDGALLTKGLSLIFGSLIREAVKNVLADFVRSGKISVKKRRIFSLADRGVPPPLNGKSQKKNLKKWVKKG